MKRSILFLFGLSIMLTSSAVSLTYAATSKLAPLPPRNIQIQQQNNAVFLTWKKPFTKKFSGFRIYRSQKSGNLGNLTVTISKGAFSFLDSNVQNGVTYFYTVRTVRNGKESKNKRQLAIKIPVDAPKTPSIIDEYVTCPRQEEKDLIERDFDIRFYNTPGSAMSWSNSQYQCDSTTFTSTNPTRVKTYNVIRFIKNIQFSRPLPFTQGKSLYEFLTLRTVSNPIYPKLIVEPHLECDIYSSGGLFSLTLGGNFSRWYPVLSGSNVCELGFGPPSNMLINDFAYHPLYAAELLVHEGYHSIIESPHTGTGGGDATIQEMGAWAAQFYFNTWIALYSTNLDDNTKQLAHDNATSILQNRFSENHCPNDNILKEVINQIIPNFCL